MATDKIPLIKEDGERVLAQAPVILSASRATDIPAFYSEWFFDRLEKGYCGWINRYNYQTSYVTFSKVRAIVFWSKNPLPIINKLHILKEKNINAIFQFTLNDYEEECFEPNLPILKERIETFKKLSDAVGADKVIWRFDPLILTHTLTVEKLLEKVKRVGDMLLGYTNKLVFSFADIEKYRTVEYNIKEARIWYREWDEASMLKFARGLQELNKRWNYELGSCCEKIELSNFGIEHNKCIDDDLLIKLFPEDKPLMQFLGVDFNPMFSDMNRFKTDNKDKGQRTFCGCANSKDVGQYNTCAHKCIYCYANITPELGYKNWQEHQRTPFGEKIVNSI